MEIFLHKTTVQPPGDATRKTAALSRGLRLGPAAAAEMEDLMNSFVSALEVFDPVNCTAKLGPGTALQ